MISDEIIAKVRAGTDLVELISEYVDLTAVGKNLQGACPIHGGTGSSFTVSPEKDLFKCFKCGASGGAVNFVMALKKIKYPDAVLFLAKRLQLAAPEIE